MVRERGGGVLKGCRKWSPSAKSVLPSFSNQDESLSDGRAARFLAFFVFGLRFVISNPLSLESFILWTVAY